jgi:hypothetical protein
VRWTRQRCQEAVRIIDATYVKVVDLLARSADLALGDAAS